MHQCSQDPVYINVILLRMQTKDMNLSAASTSLSRSKVDLMPTANIAWTKKYVERGKRIQSGPLTSVCFVYPVVYDELHLHAFRDSPDAVTLVTPQHTFTSSQRHRIFHLSRTQR
jgi:hypothetical protein